MQYHPLQLLGFQNLVKFPSIGTRSYLGNFIWSFTRGCGYQAKQQIKCSLATITIWGGYWHDFEPISSRIHHGHGSQLYFPLLGIACFHARFTKMDQEVMVPVNDPLSYWFWYECISIIMYWFHILYFVTWELCAFSFFLQFNSRKSVRILTFPVFLGWKRLEQPTLYCYSCTKDLFFQIFHTLYKWSICKFLEFEMVWHGNVCTWF